MKLKVDHSLKESISVAAIYAKLDSGYLYRETPYYSRCIIIQIQILFIVDVDATSMAKQLIDVFFPLY